MLAFDLDAVEIVLAFDLDAVEIVDRFAKGAGVYVEGRLSTNEWTGQDGEKRLGLSVISWHCRLAHARIAADGQPLVADHGHEISQPLTASVRCSRKSTPMDRLTNRRDKTSLSGPRCTRFQYTPTH